MKYAKLEWPKTKDYVNNPEHPEWLEEELDEFSGGDIGDLEDALG